MNLRSHCVRYTITIEGERIMNSMAWIGIIIWGVIVAGFGLLSAHPPG